MSAVIDNILVSLGQQFATPRVSNLYGPIDVISRIISANGIAVTSLAIGYRSVPGYTRNRLVTPMSSHPR